MPIRVFGKRCQFLVLIWTLDEGLEKIQIGRFASLIIEDVSVEALFGNKGQSFGHPLLLVPFKKVKYL